jgi:endonuclease YncB( thermonuclease family)
VKKDLGSTLLEQGLARIAPEDIPEGQSYRAIERKAKAAQRGLWANRNDAGIR